MAISLLGLHGAGYWSTNLSWHQDISNTQIHLISLQALIKQDQFHSATSAWDKLEQLKDWSTFRNKVALLAPFKNAFFLKKKKNLIVCLIQLVPKIREFSKFSQNKDRSQISGNTKIWTLIWFSIKGSHLQWSRLKNCCASQIFPDSCKVKNPLSALPAQMSNQHVCAQLSQEPFTSEQIAINYSPALSEKLHTSSAT